jgi:hypothetical protein
MELSKFSPSSVKSVLSCFNCGCDGHIARFCRQRPTHKCSIGKDTDVEFGSAIRASRCKDGVGKDTVNPLPALT